VGKTTSYVAGPELRDHPLHRVEVGLDHPNVVFLLELLHQPRVDVLGVVEVVEVTVHLRLDHAVGVSLETASDPAARETEGDRRARACLQQLAPAQSSGNPHSTRVRSSWRIVPAREIGAVPPTANAGGQPFRPAAA
jgi:hypothetical protein